MHLYYLQIQFNIPFTFHLQFIDNLFSYRSPTHLQYNYDSIDSALSIHSRFTVLISFTDPFTIQLRLHSFCIIHLQPIHSAFTIVINNTFTMHSPIHSQPSYNTFANPLKTFTIHLPIHLPIRLQYIYQAICQSIYYTI